MALQIRISTPEFSNGIAFSDPVILEYADQIQLTKTVNSSDESISFSLPLNDPKNEYLDYTQWWECWDTVTNQRLNYGPIASISRSSGDTKKITGPGRSALLLDYYKSIQAYYTPIDVFFDDIRFDNIAIQPRASTIIDIESSSTYYGLSKRSKDFVIDEQTGYLALGRDTPVKGTIKTNEFWSGTGKADWITIDLGDEYTISKSKILLPWWGGATINNNRVYEWSWEYSNDNETFTPVYETAGVGDTTPKEIGGKAIYTGEDGFEIKRAIASNEAITARYWKLNIKNTHAMYGQAFTGEYYASQSDEWGWECGGSNNFAGTTKPSPKPTTGPIIPTDKINPSSDCHASAVEIGIFRKIIDRDFISDVTYHQIENDNKQITYLRYALAQEMISCAGGGLKFEPGSFFRQMDIIAAGATIKDEYNTTLYINRDSGFIKLPAWSRLVTFYDDPNASVYSVDAWKAKIDAFSYGGTYSYCEEIGDSAIIDFRGVSFKWFASIPLEIPTTPSGRQPGAGQVSIELRYKMGSETIHYESPYAAPASVRYNVSIAAPTDYYTLNSQGKIIYDATPPHLAKGSSYVCALINIPKNSHSQGGSYYKIIGGPSSGKVFSKLTNIQHKGKISVSKLNTDAQWYPTASAITETSWSAWQTIDTVTLPVGVSGEKVWEIPLGSPLLEYDTSYQLRITNLNGGFVSIDAFAGYWSGSMETLNEDDGRITLRQPAKVIQEFNKKYSAGSIYKFKNGDDYTKGGYSFEGDRVVIYSRKGDHFGKMTIGLRLANGAIVQILTGSASVDGIDTPTYTDGYITFDLQRTQEIPQYVIFDTADYFADGLPWGAYTIGVYKPKDTDPIYFDGISAHTSTGISCKFINTSYLDILKSTAEALKLEWDITEKGLRVIPRLGTDTSIIMAEGRGTTIKIDEVQDISKVATMLIATGADIQGLPLFTVVEDKESKELFGRTIQRPYDDYRNVSDYFTLIGASRTELRKRRQPDRRISVITTDIKGLIPGDTFIVKTPELEERVRAITISRSQSSSSGTEYTMECLIWDTIA
jgi:hypothetical protein